MSSAKSLRYSILDVFAEAPLEGNPLAVVFGAGRLSTAEMQAIARETNLSETTFVLHDAARDGAWDVRIFTPRHEMPYAGHPTIGTAAAIRESHLGGRGDAVGLRLQIGVVPVRFAPDGVVWLESPPARFEEFADRAGVAAALGLPPSVLDPALPIEAQRIGPHQLFIPLRDRSAVEAARVDAAQLEKLVAAGAPASLYPFAPGAREPANHYTVRLFAPTGGVPEDPATGSAAGFFGAYLVRHRVHGEGPLDVRIEQGHALQRPSLLRVRQNGSAIQVGGRVIPVARGEWL
ncbi:MAG TPA: PhzF family phenazine biosynthesis protein [Myxococcota bacterium]|nr:PhzF family phenazine biosynthesis protein [Myxococcota bacterium]